MKRYIVGLLILLTGCKSNDLIEDLTQNVKKRPPAVAVYTEQLKVNKKKLFVNVTPSDAKIYIMNIAPKFKQGIENGKYNIRIKKEGYKTVNKSVVINESDLENNISIILEKDKLAFETSANIVHLTAKTIGRSDHDFKELNPFPKSSKLVLAMLIEQNDGDYKIPYHVKYGQSSTFDINNGLFSKAFDGLEENFSFEKNIEIIDSANTKALNLIDKARVQARSYLNSEFILKRRIRFTEKEFVAAYNSDNSTFTIPKLGYSKRFNHTSTSHTIKRDKVVDYVNLKKLKKDLGNNSRWTYTHNYIWNLDFTGVYDYRKKIQLSNISYEQALNAWNNLPKDRYTVNGQKALDVEVIMKVTSIKLDRNRGYKATIRFSPLQIRVESLNTTQKIE